MATESNKAHIDDLKEGELMPQQSSQSKAVIVTDNTVGLIAASEIDQQIATAHKYPRNLTDFEQSAMSMATKNERIATECLFALPRDGKVIEGPSVRLAEILVSAWGNCRVASRTVLEGQETVVAQGIFHDLEKNVAITSETQRRIVDKYGRRYKLDMIVTTSNAAQSIALRNAIVRGIPRAIWWDVYLRARRVAAGNEASLTTKRANAFESFKVWGVTPEQILALLGKKGEQDVDRNDLVILLGVFNSIKDGESTPEDAFPKPASDVSVMKPGKDEQKVDGAGAGDQLKMGDAAVIQKEPTPEQAKAQADFIAKRDAAIKAERDAGVSAAVSNGDAMRDAMATRGEQTEETKADPEPDPKPNARPARKAQKDLE